MKTIDTFTMIIAITITILSIRDGNFTAALGWFVVVGAYIRLLYLKD